MTLRGLLAQRARLLLTVLAVAMGVALMTGTLMLTDSTGRAVTRLVVGAQVGVDVVVRNAEDGTGPVQPIPASLLERIRAVGGTRAAAGVVLAEKVQVIGRQGRPITHRRATNQVRSVPGDPRLAGALTLQQGRAPERAGEVALDAATARREGYRLGEPLGIAGADGTVRRLRIVGVTGFAGADSPASELDTFDTPTVAVLDTRTAQALFARGSDFDEVDVQAMPGVAPEVLRARIARLLPPGRLEAVTSASLEARQVSEVQGYLEGLGALLLSFGGIALFIGAFLIWNTFTMLVAGRWRQVALLRLLGATRRQVLGSVLLEAGVVGLVAGAAGVAGGAGAAATLRALLRAMGSTLPPSGPVLAFRTVAVGLAAGTAVTVLAAILPARRASRVAPLEAVRRAVADPEPPTGRALAVGGLALVGLGVAAMVWAVVGRRPGVGLAGMGAALTLLGVLALGRLLAAPLAFGIGTPLARLAGVTGRLARDNLARSPGRTAATVAAVMVGLVLASGASVLASSAGSSIRSAVRGSSDADLYLSGGVPLGVVGRLATLPETGAAMPLDTGHVSVAGERLAIEGIEPGPAARLLRLRIRQGGLAGLGRGGVLVSSKLASGKHWRVGSVAPVRFDQTGTTMRLPVAGVFAGERLFASDLIVSLDLLRAGFPSGRAEVGQVLVSAAEGVPPARLRAAVERVVALYPNVELRDAAAYERARSADLGDLGGVLGLLTALAVLAVVIGMLAVANTLALSVFERTRELGLLRAVGMTARQLAAMIRWESLIVALSGAAAGTGLGASLGAGLATALTTQQTGVATVDLPAGRLLAYLVAGALAGLLAAAAPARRAGRMRMLDAVGVQ